MEETIVADVDGGLELQRQEVEVVDAHGSTVAAFVVAYDALLSPYGKCPCVCGIAL